MQASCGIGVIGFDVISRFQETKRLRKEYVNGK